MFGFFFSFLQKKIYIDYLCPCTYTMWVLTWRPWPTWAIKPRGPRVRILLPNQHKSTGVILQTSGLLFGFCKAWSLFFFSLFLIWIALFWFMIVPIDGCYFDSFPQPQSWIHKFCFQYLLWLPAIRSWNLKVHLSKQMANTTRGTGRWIPHMLLV